MRLFKTERIAATWGRWNDKRKARDKVFADGVAELWIDEAALMKELGTRALQNGKGIAILGRGMIRVVVKDRFQRVESPEEVK